MQPVRFTRTARKHRIGKAHALHVLNTCEPTRVATDRDEQLVWIGADDRGVELEIVALEKPDCLLVIHVMPTHYRK
jgi:hypothetical protein